MRLCVAQYQIVLEDKSRNAEICRSFIENAKMNGAAMMVFPELSLTGFSFSAPEEKGRGDFSTVDFFSEIARSFGMACVFGYARKCDGKVYNTLVAVDSSGRPIAGYDKMHLFSIGGESDVCTAGTEICVFNYGGFSFGLTICYDLRFPELYSKLAETCDCIIVSANWGAARTEHWDTLLRSRSIETQCYVAGCNCLCTEGMECGGNSAIYAPDGTRISFAGESEKLIYADISENIINNVRAVFPQRNDRRIEIYRNFYE